MRTLAIALSIALLPMAVGCTNGDDPQMAEGPTPEETAAFAEAQEAFRTRATFGNAMRFRTKTTFENGVFSVEARREGASPRTLTTAAHRQYEWATYLPTPPIPGFVSREWFLAENRADGRTILYAAVEWDDANPADYLSVGWWLHFPPGVPGDEYELAERGVFIDGPELDSSHPPEMPVSGEATYAGGAGGLYEYLYGSGWGELKGESQYVEFSAPIELTADFSEGTIAGCIGCAGDIEDETLHLWPAVEWRGPDPDALPKDYEIHLGPAPLNPGRHVRERRDLGEPSRAERHGERGRVGRTVLQRRGRGRQSPAGGGLRRGPVRRGRRQHRELRRHLLRPYPGDR